MHTRLTRARRWDTQGSMLCCKVGILRAAQLYEAELSFVSGTQQPHTLRATIESGRTLGGLPLALRKPVACVRARTCPRRVGPLPCTDPRARCARGARQVPAQHAADPGQRPGYAARRWD